jgi:lambda family phage portal protein
MAALFGSEPKRGQSRMYAAARGSRLTGGYGVGGDSSADAELSSSLTRLRSASRQMVRDSAYAKRARTIVVNNVIGSGVGMQAQVMTTRKVLAESVNASIEEAWCEWMCAENCHTGGALHFNDFERAAMAQVFEAGEVFVRKHYSSFGESRIPLALELIEAERVPLDIAMPGAPGGAEVRMGIERDTFGRAIAYWIRERHPGDINRGGGPATDRYERVPAEHILHLRLVDRWPQTRGEPWLHTSARKLNDMDQYSGAEVQAARMSSYLFGTIESKDEGGNLPTDEEDDGTQVMDIQPGLIQQLNPGETLNFHNPNRPNVALDPFMRYMLREVAAGCGVSYESLSRDYSQSNYSSSRLALLDDRDLWRMLQQWWIRAFRKPLHKVWLRQAVYSRAVAIDIDQYVLNASKFEAVLFKPRGWSWIDPTKEVEAYKEAIKAGLTTLTDVIAQTADGRDIEDVITTRAREIEMLKAADIAVDTDVAAEQEAAKAKAAPPKASPVDEEEPERARVVAFKRDAG